jgi:hypothetical protein
VELRITTVRVAAVGISPTVGYHDAWTVLFVASRTLLTIWSEARRVLRTNSNAVADFEVAFDTGADAEDFAYYFVADAYRYITPL